MPERKVEVRFANYEPVTPMKYLKSQCIGPAASTRPLELNLKIKAERAAVCPVFCPLHDTCVFAAGKFVSVKGTVIRVSTIKPVLIEMKFLCTKCGFETLQRMTEGKFESPTCCSQVPVSM